jgi:hypothetical protein
MRQLFIDSRDKVSGSSADFTVALPSTLNTSSTQRMRIDAWRVPMTIPTVRPGVADQVVITVGVGNYTLTLPGGQYDGATLAATLQSLLANAAPGTWTVTYDASNVAMTIANTNPFTFNGGSLGKLWLSYPYTTSADSKTWRFSYVSMLGVDVVYLACGQFANLDCVGPKGVSDIILAAPVTCGFGTVLEASMPQDCWFDAPELSTNQLSFQVRDRDGRILPLPNTSFTMTID